MKTRYWLVPLWIACGVATYFSIRSDASRRNLPWTVGYRTFAIVMALWGPLNAFSLLAEVVRLIRKLFKMSPIDWDKPASW